LTLIFFVRIYLYINDVGSPLTALAKNLSNRCPASFFFTVMICILLQLALGDPFLLMLSTAIIQCFFCFFNTILQIHRYFLQIFIYKARKS
jgi:hypothetical protein